MNILTKPATWTLVLFLACSFAGPARAQADSEALAEGMALFYQQEWDACIPAFEHALQKDPQDSLALCYILHAYYKKKDIQTIINEIEMRAVARGEDPITKAHLGMAYFLRGMIMPNVLDEALTEFKGAIKDDPGLAMGYTGLGMVYFQKRMMPRSKGYFVKALRINPNDVMALDLLGNIMLVDEKKPADSLQLFQRIIAILPTYPDGYYYVGSSLFDLNRYDEAVAHLIQARDLDPHGVTKGFDAATLLGETYLKQDRKAEAIDAFEYALKMDPESEYVKYKLKEIRGPN